MKRLLIILLVLISSPLFGQTFQWAKQLSYTNYYDFQNQVRGSATDSIGNTYVLVQYQDTLIEPTTNISLPNDANLAVAVAKFSPNGSLSWLLPIAGPGYVTGGGIIINGLNELLITGEFTGSIDFDPGIGVDSSASNQEGGFIVNLNSSGNLNWVKLYEAPGTSICRLGEIFLEKDNYLIFGEMNGTIDFNPGGTAYNTTTNSSEFFILKLDPQGNYIWIKTFEGDIKANDLTVDSDGDIYYTGSFYNYCDFNPGIGIAGLSAYGIPNRSDIFVSSLDINGNFKWVSRQGGTYNEYATSIALDSNKNVYTTGTFTYIVDFDPSNNTVNLSSGSNNDNDIFISSLDSNGSFNWVKHIESPENEGGAYIRRSSANELILLGTFKETLDSDPDSSFFYINNASTATISAGTFISKFTLAGQLKVTYPISSNKLALGTQFDLDANDNIYVIGSFDDSTDFDPTNSTFWLKKLSPHNAQRDIFLFKFRNCSNVNNTTIDTCDKNPIIFQGTNVYTNSVFNFFHGDSQGCDSIVSYKIRIGNLDTAIQKNGTQLLTNQNNASYQWFKCNPYSIITGANNQSYTAVTNGDYAVIISQNNCSDTSACVKVNSVGLNDISLEGISVFPNPMHNWFTIKTTNNFNDASFRIMNSLGQVIKTENSIYGKSIDIDMSKYSLGIYTLEVRQDTKVSRLKILKQ